MLSDKLRYLKVTGHKTTDGTFMEFQIDISRKTQTWLPMQVIMPTRHKTRLCKAKIRVQKLSRITKLIDKDVQEPILPTMKWSPLFKIYFSRSR